MLRLQNYDEENTTWETLLKVGRPMPAGYYVMVTGTRLANGGVLARMTSLSVAADEYAETKLVMRESKDEIQVIGSLIPSLSLLHVMQDSRLILCPSKVYCRYADVAIL